MTSTSSRYDVVIVGGGINGAGIARDAALRGLSVLLLEQNDFGSGTSSWSSRLIHGGLRYLEYGEIPLVYESLRERRVLQSTAKHLVKRLRMNIPVYEHSKRGMLLLRLGMIAYDLLSLGKPLPRHRVLDRKEFLANEPGVNPDGLRGGVQYFDAQVPFAERLVLENVLDAARAGAVVRNYSPVTAIVVRQGRVAAVRYRDGETNSEAEVTGRIVVNATGPWVDQLLETANLPMAKYIGGTRGSHIVVGPFPGAPRDAFYVEAEADARPFFIIPWNGQYLVGTTDIRDDGDPALAAASPAEVDYLLTETNRTFPRANLRPDAINFTYAGIRPLPKRSAGPESAITRKHIIVRHENARGLWTVIGGKLTTYRSLAEDAVDRMVKRSNLSAGPCTTREQNLPGAGEQETAAAAVRQLRQLTPEGHSRLLDVYGSRAAEIARLVLDGAGPTAPGDRQQEVCDAEVAFTIRYEFAKTLTDILHRRTMTGLGPDLGDAVAEGVARAAAAELGWNEGEAARQLAALRAYNSRLRAPAKIS